MVRYDHNDNHIHRRSPLLLPHSLNHARGRWRWRPQTKAPKAGTHLQLPYGLRVVSEHGEELRLRALVQRHLQVPKTVGCKLPLGLVWVHLLFCVWAVRHVQRTARDAMKAEGCAAAGVLKGCAAAWVMEACFVAGTGDPHFRARVALHFC